MTLREKCSIMLVAPSFVELFINDSYRGVYVFMEKLKRDDGRINIDKLKEDENSGEAITGGYILKN